MKNRQIDDELMFDIEFPSAKKLIVEEAIKNRIDLSDYYFAYSNIGDSSFSVTYFLDGADDNSFYISFYIDKDKGITLNETSINGK